MEFVNKIMSIPNFTCLAQQFISYYHQSENYVTLTKTTTLRKVVDFMKIYYHTKFWDPTLVCC